MFSINEKCLNKTENIYEPNVYYYKGLNKLENNELFFYISKKFKLYQQHPIIKIIVIIFLKSFHL